MRLDSYQVVFRIKHDPNQRLPDGYFANPIKSIEATLHDAFPEHAVEVVEISMRPTDAPVLAGIAEPNPAPAILAKPKRRIAP